MMMGVMCIAGEQAA